jgi:enamine deaminase RidA (YjgF/YER057c/UK114 family)
MSKFNERLATLGLTLPITAPAMARYAPVALDGDLAYVSGQLPRDGDRITVLGPVGNGTSLEDARNGARLAVLRGLAALNDEIKSFDRVRRILKLTVFVHSAPDFVEQSEVADGASEILYALFDKAGAHARTAIGVAQLPKNASVEVDLVIALHPLV